MKQLLIVLSLLTPLQLVSSQERLSREEALQCAIAVSADVKQLNGTPIATSVDAQQPVAVKDADYGGMVLPQKNLTVVAIEQAGETAVPIGQLWLLKLTPMNNGAPIAKDRLRLVTVRAEGAEFTVPQCTLAVRRNAGGSLELLVYGKTREPLVTVALKPLAASQAVPLDLAAERDGDVGNLTLTILGAYEARLSVTELDS